MTKISKRLVNILDQLPLKEGLRILEIGCGTGNAAREICRRYENIFVLAIDRSEKAIRQCMENSKNEIKSGKLEFQEIAIEDLNYSDKEFFDFAFAIRVGALDGRHPGLEKQAKTNIKRALKANGKLYIDVSDNSIVEISL